MRNLRTVIGAACACVLLANCSYFSGEDRSERIELENGQAFYGEAFEPVEEISEADARVLATQLVAEGPESVEVFDFDGSAPYFPPPQDNFVPLRPDGPIPLTAMTRDPAYTDGSVEVYAFGDSVPVSAEIYMPETAGPILPPETVISSNLAPPGGDPFNSDKAAKIYFDHGVEKLSASGQATLAKLVEEVGRTGHPLKVSGYASQRASTDNATERKVANLKTSMDRAYEVTRYLIKEGVPAENIETTGWGEVNPALPTADMDSEAASRRVEITAKPLY